MTTEPPRTPSDLRPRGVDVRATRLDGAGARGAQVRAASVHLRAAGPRWLLAAAGVGAAGLVVVPVVGALLALALRAAGLPALTHLDVGTLLSSPVAVLLLVVAVLLVAVTVLVQQGVLVGLVASALRGRPARLRPVLTALRGPVRRVLGPGALLLLLHAVVLVPLGALGVGAALVRDVEVPEFITGELLRFDGGLVVLVAAALALTWVDLRLALTVPLLVLSDRGVAASFAASWRATRRTWWRLGLALGAVGVVVAGLTALVGATVLAPTRLADAHAPGLAAVVAGTSLAFVTCVGVLLTAFAAAATALVTTWAALPDASGTDHGLLADEDAAPDPRVADARGHDAQGPVPTSPGGRRLRGRALTAVVVAAFVVLAGAGTLAVTAATEPRASLVVAHRGDYADAVENTIEALDAAAASGADLVELDVLQTADGGLVVFHDLTLRRLAGDGRTVASATTAELEDVVLTQDGRTGRIPTLESFVRRAAELDVGLLVELKTHGGETASYVADVVAVLRTQGVAARTWVQAFDTALADEVERLAPEVRTGYVVAFARGVRARPPVDFVALEQSSATPSVRARARAAGLDVLVWTVERPEAMRSLFRAGVDGIITGSAPAAVAVRDEVATEAGVAPRLEELVRQQLRR